MLQFFNIGNGQIPPKFTRREHFLTLFDNWWRVIKSLVKWLTETNDYNAINRENVVVRDRVKVLREIPSAP